ncbi:MAG: xanthine dehydrogenase family protein molybdopterin-binding subunit [Chloroflexi bacterium]|nr:xanthine dehydrogenase family protein molybdopterin-binding subunit [Chloroflexota bacterium]
MNANPLSELPQHQLPISQPRYVGQDVPRIEDPLLLTGRAEFGDNIHKTGMLHAAILRSPYAHARIRGIDTSRAEALPGVAAVLVGAEVKAQSRPVFGIPEGWTGHALAVEKTHWAGEPVAIVAAEDRYVAEDALELIEVDYEPLEPMVNALEAADGKGPVVLEGKDTNVMYARKFTFGDVDTAFAEADLVVNEDSRWHRSAGNPIETCVCIARWDPFDQSLTLEGSHRSPLLVMPALVGALGLSPTQIRIYTSPLGGSFGVKTFARYVILLSLLAKKLGGRPVKWTEDRIEHLAGNSSHAWDRHHNAAMAVRQDGTITAVRIRAMDDFGAFGEWLGVGQIVKPITIFPGCYRIPAYEYDCAAVLTNKVPQGPYRGFGLPSHYWVLEQLVDLAAEKLGMDRAEIRRKNFIRRDEFPYTIPSGNVYDSGDYEAGLDLLLEKADYAALKEQQAAARKQGRLVGLSVVTSIEPGLTGTPMLGLLSPRMFSRTSSPEGMALRMDGFGKMIAQVGFPWGGQSQHTFVRQILADYFAVKAEDVQVVVADSSTMQPGMGPVSSRIAVALGGAVVGAAKLLAEKLGRVAAVMLEADPGDVELKDGAFQVRGAPARSAPVPQVAGFMLARADKLPEGVDGNPEVSFVWNPPDHYLADEQGRSHYGVTATSAVHLCMLEVDHGTGQVEILRYVMVDDCGVRLNPSVVRGQLLGSLAQGLGNALYEEYVYDDQGQLLTTTYMDYLMPTVMEVPVVEEYEQCTPSPVTSLGQKGVGEGALHTTPAAVRCAINDALHPLGVHIAEAPATPFRIWSALQAAATSP